MIQIMSKHEKKKINIKGNRMLQLQEVIYKNPLKDVYTASLPIAGCAWIDTHKGVVLIDTLLTVGIAKKVRQKITETIKYIIYTHGHVDHVGGTAAFMDDNPEVIANKYLPDRLDKYKMLAPHRARIAAQQFNIPEIISPSDFVYPTKTFLGEMIFSLGDKTFELHTARAETDDVCWIHVPELKTAFIGDLMIGVFPNIGNPWKPTRFALDWAKTLEEIKTKDLNYIFCNGAGVMYKEHEVQDALNANIEVIRSLHDQVVNNINKGMHVSEMIHEIKIPDHLKNSPYLKMLYSRPEFFVFNVYRWYHGYFDDNPANLLPRPRNEVIREIYNLIGNPETILKRARELLVDNQAQLAIQVLDVLIQADPENLEARKLRIELLSNLGAQDYCLMSRNAWVYFLEKDKEFLRKKGEIK